jgi:hypothetical protein
MYYAFARATFHNVTVPMAVRLAGVKTTRTDGHARLTV